MKKEVVVRKYYPKLNGKYISHLDENGFQLAKSKGSAKYFRQNENITLEEIKNKIDEFYNLGSQFGLTFTWDVAEVIHISNKYEDVKYDHLFNSITKEESI